jgi:hypothetical protein
MRVRVPGVVGLAVIGSLAAFLTLEAKDAGRAATPRVEAPRFEVDPSWPTIPNGWVLGQVSSAAVDEQDHIWIIQRPRTLRADQKGKEAPPVMEFDAAGHYLQGWGGPGAGYEWPGTEHSVFVDHKGFVWVTGSGNNDDQILKFTKAGKFVLQIGHSGQSKGNADTQNVNKPADVFVYPKTNEAFVADGYGNRRVIVFDADTGAFKRMWGAFGRVATDEAPAAGRGRGAAEDRAALNSRPPAMFETGRGADQFTLVHATRVSNDGLVYVSDRGGKRVQVFTLDGKFVDQAFIDRWCEVPQCGTNGHTAASTAFSADPAQRFLYVASRSAARVWILDRRTLKPLDSFGRPGVGPGEFYVIHELAVDAKGNLYACEVEDGRRIQKFTFKGVMPVSAALK